MTNSASDSPKHCAIFTAIMWALSRLHGGLNSLFKASDLSPPHFSIKCRTPTQMSPVFQTSVLAIYFAILPRVHLVRSGRESDPQIPVRRPRIISSLGLPHAQPLRSSCTDTLLAFKYQLDNFGRDELGWRCHLRAVQSARAAPSSSGVVV